MIKVKMEDHETIAEGEIERLMDSVVSSCNSDLLSQHGGWARLTKNYSLTKGGMYYISSPKASEVEILHFDGDILFSEEGTVIEFWMDGEPDQDYYWIMPFVWPEKPDFNAR
ncbi:MAG: hypothetical protein PVI43_00405 [Candidatus Bathyarchaeota archaeon]|jgi:hypothetical protein